MPTKSTAVEKTAPAQELAVPDADVQALIAQQESEFDSDLVSTPILKIGQPLTREVQNEQAEAGEFINTLTGEGIGTNVEFIVAYYQKGRFAADRDSGRAFVAFQDTIPDAWSDLVGEDWVGTPFAEFPDAEETYKVRVNRGDIEWGKGPLVSTTHNFTGLALVPVLGDDGQETDEVEMQAVRLSLQRTNMQAVRNWMSLKRSLRNKAFWDKTFLLGTYKKAFDRGSAHLLTVKLGRDTTAEERSAAVELATLVAAGRVTDNSATDARADSTVEPDAKGGLAV